MLSIKKIESAQVAQSYFRQDDYYAEKGDTPGATGVWFGKGAEALGLSGQVDSTQFKAILDGTLPNGEQLGTIREKGGEKQHTPGWDLTFSAPKSASILALVAGDERLREAHDEAVREALGWVEAHIAGHRRKGFLGTTHVDGDNLTAALFRHVTSREKDPQMHTHAVVMNANLDDQGKWRSLDSHPLYEFKMAVGNIYRAAYAARVQELGYAIERVATDGRWEIAAVPEAVRQHFSLRSEKIQEAMKAYGLEGAADAERAALRTRPAKTVAPIEQLRADWRRRAAERGFDPARTVAEARAAGPQAPAAGFRMDQAISRAVSRLADKEAVFSDAKLLQWSLAGSMGHARVREVERGITAAAKENEILETRLPRARAWTTPAARKIEKDVIALWRSTQRSVPAPMDEATARKGLARAFVDAVRTNAKARELNDGQTAGALAILTQRDRFIGIEGRPGVGKTTLLGRVRPVLEAAGFTPIGLAGNANAAQNLQTEAGLTARTLSRHLIEAERALVKVQHSPLERHAVLAETRKQVWIIDEASQIGAKQMKRTMVLADKLGARVVMIGDTKQLAAISAGKPFGQLMQNGMQRTVIETNLRQRKQAHKEAVAKAAQGDVRAALALLGPDSREYENREERLAAIVDAWSQLGDARAKATVLTARNAERLELNERIRDVLRDEGQLAGEVAVTAVNKVYAERVDKADVLTYKAGDLVQFGRGIHGTDITRNSLFRVVAIDRDSNELVLQSLSENDPGRRILWNPAKAAGSAWNGVEVYRTRATSLAPGEKIQWSANTRGAALADGTRLVNGQLLTVAEASPERVTLRTEQGATVTIDPRSFEGQTWDHAYATTVYKSQGRTEDHVLVNAEAGRGELFNQKAFVVAVSRQRESVTLFMDHRERFADNIAKRLGEKTTVAEARSEDYFERMRVTMNAVFDALRGSSTSHDIGGEALPSHPGRVTQGGGSPASSNDPARDAGPRRDPLDLSR